ncbi:MAG: protein kinase [Gemmatimonadales bacterium]|nr:protein kinase [Gemmatimonadales bacterium]
MTAPHPPGTDPAPDLLTSLRRGLAGRYEIEGEIGRGGMAVVYRGLDLRHHRAVALKVLRPGFVAGDGTERFLREIRVVAGLAHPHILPLYDSGELAGDPPLLYFVMPFIVGESLRAHLVRTGRLPLDRALRVAREVATALDYAHRHQVVHRDVKPENILLHEGVALVTDFGIARLISESATENVTAPGLAIGTPAYMSPEQAGGDGTIDGRADQYGLACVLFEMLAGTPPFTGQTRVLLSRHLTETAPSVRSIEPAIPVAIDQVIARALAKEPADRFPSAAALAAALGTPLSGLNPDPPPRSAHSPGCCLAVLPFANASGEAENEYLGDGLTDELITAFGQIPELRVASRSASFALKGTRKVPSEIGALLGVDTILEGSVRKQADRIRIAAQLTETATSRILWSERYDRNATDLFAVEEEIARTIVGTLRGGLLAPGTNRRPAPRQGTDNPAAYAHYLRGRYAWNKRTATGVTEAVSHFEAAIATDSRYALAFSGLADTYALGVDYRGITVTEGMSRARALATEALALDDTLAEAHTSLAWVTFIHDWDWPKAAHHFHRAIELDPRYPTARQWHSWFLAAMGRTREAIAEARLGVELDPASPSIRRSVGWLYHMAREPEAGLDDLRRAVVMNPESSETHLLLGQSLTWAGHYAEADLSLREAISLDPENTYALSAIGRLRALQGRLADAREIRDRMLSLARYRYVSPSDLTRIHLALNEIDEAFVMLERARNERRGFVVYLRVEPSFDPLRGDPRFIELCRRMRLD